MPASMNPEEVYQKLDDLFAQYTAALDEYSDVAFFLKPDPAVWSVGQMYEHLLVSTKQLMLLKIWNCLTQVRGSVGGEKTLDGERLFQYGSFPPIKIKTPVEWQKEEPIAQSRDTYRTAFTQLRNELKEIYPQVAADDGTYKTKHVVLGMLTAWEWFLLMEMHTRHHLRQKSELDESIKRT